VDTFRSEEEFAFVISTSLTIRAAVAQDIEAIADLWCLQQDTQATESPSWESDSLTRKSYSSELFDLLDQPDHIVRVMFSSGKIIGFVRGEFVEESANSEQVRRGVISEILVDPALRDAGIGAKMVKSVVEALHHRGVHQIEATVDARDHDSIRILERARFELSQVTLSCKIED